MRPLAGLATRNSGPCVGGANGSWTRPCASTTNPSLARTGVTRPSGESAGKLAPIRDLQWQTVPGLRRICRVIVFVCEVPLTVYANDARLPLAKLSVAVPTVVVAMRVGSNGVAVNAGPVVRTSGPV